MYIAAQNKYNWNINTFTNLTKKMLVLYIKYVLYINIYIYIYIAARNKYNWDAFNNLTKKDVLYKICYIYNIYIYIYIYIIILPHKTSTTGMHTII